MQDYWTAADIFMLTICFIEVFFSFLSVLLLLCCHEVDEEEVV